MERIEFKVPNPEEFVACLSMIEHFYAIDQYPFDSGQARKNLGEITTSEELGRFWLLARDSVIVGYLILTFGYSFEYGGRDAFIDEFYLKEEFRGMGIGTQVLESLAVRAKGLGVHAIHLEVEKSNRAGNSLYKRVGFKGNDRSLLTKIINE